MKAISMVLGGLSVLAGVAMSGEAAAVTVERNLLSHGTAQCQSALPVFDGRIRKRPLALANEGAGNAFITCDSEQINNNGTGFNAVRVFFTNRAGADPVIVNCTLVDGVFNITFGAGFYPKASAPMPTGTIGEFIEWTDADDNGGNNFTAPAISCNLPPGVDISLVNYIFDLEVGM